MKNQLIIKKSMAMMLMLVMLFSFVGLAMAQDNSILPGKNGSIVATQQGPTDPAEMETFLDELIEGQMEEFHIAGAAVSVVKDGKLFFAKGYGYADLEDGVPVDPEETIFRIGSIGKVFTWTAVMQLVEQGKLDLDADINTYLDFRIPDTYPQPITLKHLMTHTSGLEEWLIGGLVPDANDLVPEREWLVSHLPKRVRPPGDAAAYSNPNPILAGYIVSLVSGQPYEQYIQEHILDPLGMVHSTAQGMMPSKLRPYASVGYTYADGAFQVFPDYLAQPAGIPSGFHRASATDMARFMIAHLQNGRYSDANIGERRILKEATAQQMHSTQYTSDPRLKGITYGFFDFSNSGQRTIGHRGYAPPMHSLMMLLPNQNLGFFVTYNSMGGDYVANPQSGFHKAFLDHYFPAPAVEPIQPPADFAERANRFVGSYRTTSFPYTTLTKVVALFGGYTAQISDPGDGTLLFATAYGEFRYVEVEPLYFRQVDGPFALVFREDDQGRIVRIDSDLMNYTALDKLDWYETSGFNMALLQVSVLIFLSMIPIAAIRLIWVRRLSGDRKSASRSARAAYWLILGISALNLLFVAGVFGIKATMISELHALSFFARIVLGLGVLSAVLTVGALVYTALAWKNSYWGTAGRVYYTLVTVAAVAFVWFLNYWNLLGWRF